MTRRTPAPPGPLLGVNIDHVATLRQARFPHRGGAGASPQSMAEPDPVRAAHEAELGGAGCITAHLREDRRHVIDRDVRLLREVVRVKFNLEMAATPEMVALAGELRPHMVTLVPEGREEVTTEGGLDVRGQMERLRRAVDELTSGGIECSAFIDPSRGQVEAAAAAGFQACELHTGPYAHAFAACGGDFRAESLARAADDLHEAGRHIVDLGMRFNAGHALNFVNVAWVARLEGVSELHIGHALVARAVYVGLRGAVAEMVGLIRG